MRGPSHILAAGDVRGALALLAVAGGVLVVPASFLPAAGEAKDVRKKATGAETTARSSSAKGKTQEGAAPGRAEPTQGSAGAGQPAAKSGRGAPEPDTDAAPNATLAPEDLVEFGSQPAAVKRLLESALELSRRNLVYLYGSDDPANGGMDCSGFVHYLLRQHGFTNSGRDSSSQYVWVRRAREFRAVVSRSSDSFELGELLPGDLLFWTGTYTVIRDPPITHVMIYLGTEKATGARVMVGSSDGRTYRGRKRNGVSVFDFTLPRASGGVEPRATFVGYGRIPGLRGSIGARD